jgi:hypothetical protein
MRNFTTTIRNEFLENDVLTVHSLYDEFVDSSASKSEQDYQKHKIRSVVNSLHKREEINRFDDGIYKKTDKILDHRGVQEKPMKQPMKKQMKKLSNAGRISGKKEKFVEPKYDESFD